MCALSNHESLLIPELDIDPQNSRTWPSYSRFTFFVESEDAELLSAVVVRSSSWCTAIENRFQNAGSRTPAIDVIEELSRGLYSGLGSQVGALDLRVRFGVVWLRIGV